MRRAKNRKTRRTIFGAAPKLRSKREISAREQGLWLRFASINKHNRRTFGRDSLGLQWLPTVACSRLSDSGGEGTRTSKRNGDPRPRSISFARSHSHASTIWEPGTGYSNRWNSTCCHNEEVRWLSDCKIAWKYQSSCSDDFPVGNRPKSFSMVLNWKQGSYAFLD